MRVRATLKYCSNDISQALASHLLIADWFRKWFMVSFATQPSWTPGLISLRDNRLESPEADLSSAWVSINWG